MGAEFILPGCTAVLEARGALRARPLGQGHALRAARAARRRDPARARWKRRSRRSTPRSRTGEPMDGVSGARSARRGSRSTPARGRRSSPAPRSRPPRPRTWSRPPSWRCSRRVSDLPAPGDRRRQRAARRGARRRGRPRARSTSAIRVRAIAERPDRAGVVVGTDGGEIEADACVVAVPASVIGRIEFDPPLPARRRGRSASIRYGHAAKLFVPLRSTRRCRRARRSRCPTATGPGRRPATGRRSQPVVSAFAGSAPALARSASRPARPPGPRSSRRCAPISTSSRDGGGALDLGRRPLGRRRLLGRDPAPRARRC